MKRQNLFFVFILLLLFFVSACQESTVSEPAANDDRITVFSHFPEADATDVSVDIQLTALFSRGLNSATLNAGTFLLTTIDNSETKTITGTVSYDSAVGTFTPTTQLQYETLYTATISNSVTSKSGAPLTATKTWKFTTGEVPPVMSTVPESDATEVSLSIRKIKAVFQADIDSTTLSNTTFLVKDPNDVSVAGTYTVENSREAVFEPANALEPTTIYTVTVTTDLFYSSGDALPKQHSWSFTTEATAWAGLKQLDATADMAAYDVSTDGAGNVYIAGYSSQDGTTDLLAVKYNSSGVKQWEIVADANDHDVAKGVAVNSSAAFVCGYTSDGSAGGKEIYLKKLSVTDGSNLKPDHSAGDGASDDEATAIVSDGTSGVYYTGYTSGNFPGTSAGGKDFFVVHLDGDLAQTNLGQYGSSGDDIAYGLALDASADFLYVTGSTSGAWGTGQTNSGGLDIFLTKIRVSDGTAFWTKIVGTTSDDEAYAIAIDSTGDIYMTGYSSGYLGGLVYNTSGASFTNKGGKDVFLLRFDDEGTQKMVQLDGGSADEVARAIVINSEDKVFVSGYTTGDISDISTDSRPEGNTSNYIFYSSFQYVTIDDAYGNPIEGWGVQTRQTGTTNNDQAFGMAINSNDDFFVVGLATGQIGEVNATDATPDVFILKAADASGDHY
jgi:hypothetical protein